MRATIRPAIKRRLARLCRLAGAGLFLVLCGHTAYDAGGRGRESAILRLPACAAMPQG